MADPNRITHDNPEPGDVSPGCPGGAPGPCDMTDATMAAVPDEAMSTRGGEACGAECGSRPDGRADGRGGRRGRRPGATVGTLGPEIPKPGSGPCLPTDLPGRHAHRSRPGRRHRRDVRGRNLDPRGREGGRQARGGVAPEGPDLAPARRGRRGGGRASGRGPVGHAPRPPPGAARAGCRVSGRVRSEASIAAIGVGDDGHRRLVGLACASAGGHASWRGLPQDSGGRGACDVLAKADTSEDRRPRPRRHVPHPRGVRPRARARPLPRGRRRAGPLAPDASRVPGDAGAGALACPSLPRGRRIKIRTNNARGRTSREPRRRTKVARAFPSTGSAPHPPGRRRRRDRRRPGPG